MVKKLLTYSFLLLAWACSRSENDPLVLVDPYVSPLEGLPDMGRLRFDQPQIGQRSYYVLFKATQTPSGSVNFIYLPDTMIMAITGQQNGQWTVKQFYTRGSDKVKAGTSDLADSVATFSMLVQPDSIHFVKGNSSLILTPIGLGKPLDIPLEASTNAPENSGCLPLFDYSVSIWTAYTLNQVQHGDSFNYLVNYFDYTAMSGDGSGFTYCYGPSFGITRFAWVSAWDLSKADGWDLTSR